MFSLAHHSTASLKIDSGGEGAVIIGGYCFTACIGEYCMGEEISTIAMYSDYDPYYGDAGWKVIGNLKSARFEHASISNGQMIMTVGGRDLRETELMNWEAWDGNDPISDAFGALESYRFPLLFLVENNYCSNETK